MLRVATKHHKQQTATNPLTNHTLERASSVLRPPSSSVACSHRSSPGPWLASQPKLYCVYGGGSRDHPRAAHLLRYSLSKAYSISRPASKNITTQSPHIIHQLLYHRPPQFEASKKSIYHPSITILSSRLLSFGKIAQTSTFFSSPPNNTSNSENKNESNNNMSNGKRQR
jgi:hypothetical protein